MKKILFNLLLILSTTILFAQNKGLEIAKAARTADEGYSGYSAELEMKLNNANGQESPRNMSIKSIETPNDGDKLLITFNSPKDVKGTAMLTFSYKTENNDQWLFLPAIKRVKRISSNNKSRPFMGSEFSYEDLGSQELEKYRFKFIDETTINDMKIAVVEKYPLDSKSCYSKQIIYYNLNKNYGVEKSEFFDRKETLLKTMNLLNYQQYNEKHWSASEYFVINHQTNKETRLLYKAYNFNIELNEDGFLTLTVQTYKAL